MALGYDGSIRINTQVDRSGFSSGIKNIESGIGKLNGSLKKMAGLVGAAFGITALVNFGKQAVSIASDLAEVQNVVETSFGAMTDQVNAWAKNSIKQFGMSELSAKRMASTYMAMNAGMGLNGQGAAEMAMKTAERAADISSFYNKSIEESDTMLKSIWTGETESLKQIGVVMTQTNLDAYALANGMSKTTSEMTQAEQVQLRYQYVMDQTRLAAGDFAKTQGSWANQTRILSEQFKQLLGILGQGLIQILTPALQFLNQFMGVLIGWAQSFNAIVAGLFGTSAQQQSQQESGIQSIASATGNAAAAQDNLQQSTTAANKALKKQISGFDELNILQTKDDAAASGGSGISNLSPSSGGVSVPAFSGDLGAGIEVSPDVQRAVDTVKGIFANLRTALQPTKDALQGLWTELERIGGFAWQGLIGFYDNFLKPVGTWVLGEGLPRFVNITAGTLSQINWDRINSALNTLWQALAPFAINVGEGLLWFYENVLSPLGVWVMNEVVPRFLGILAEGIETVNGVVDALKPTAQWLFDNFLRPIADWTGGVIVSVLDGLKNALEGISGWVSQNGEMIIPIIAGIGAAFATWKIAKLTSEIKTFIGNDGIGMLGLALQSVGEEHFPNFTKKLTDFGSKLKSFGTKVGGGIKSLCTSKIGLIVLAIGAVVTAIVWLIQNWDAVKNAAIACWNKIVEAWNTVADWFKKNVIDPIVNFFTGLWDDIKETFSKVGTWFSDIFNQAVDGIKNAFNGIGNFFGNVWRDIQNAFSHVTDWFKNIFKNAWEGVKNVFSAGGQIFAGIQEGISTTFKNVVNAIVSGLNTVIAFPFNTINGFLNTIKDINILGLTPFYNLWGYNPLPVPQIPYLAKGAVIPPRQQFAAILGDQKHGRNLETPEGLLRDIVRQESGTAGLLSKLDSLERAVREAKEFIMVADGVQIARVVEKNQKSTDRRFRPVSVKG